MQRNKKFDLACGHEKGEDEDEGALGHWQPVSLLQGEEDGSIQAGFSGAVRTDGSLSGKYDKSEVNFNFYIRLSFI